MSYEKTTFAGRFQAHSPYYEAQSLDSRRGRPLERHAELLRDNQLALSDNSTIDIGGLALPADDEADIDSGDGSHDVGGY